MNITLILIVALVVIVGYVVGVYNSLIRSKVRVTQSWKDIDIQLKKRYDLLPDLVETAKKATALDEKILTEVTRLRNMGLEEANAGRGPAARAEVEGQLSGLMRDVKVQVEAYPDIKSHGELLKLMDNLTDIEEKIAYSRQFYNSNAGDFNTKVKVFPTVFFANLLGFKEAEFFEATEVEKEDIKVQF